MDAMTINMENNSMKGKTLKPLLWIGIVSILMLFAGLTSAYIVSKADGGWLQFELPKMFYLSTVIIIISSISMNYALISAKRNNINNIKIALAFTLILGLGFVFSQFMAWKTLVGQEVFLVGNVSGSFLYVLSGMHLAHLAGGIISLSVVLSEALKEQYNSQNKLGLELCSIYWHFLDVLWVYLFLFLVFTR